MGASGADPTRLPRGRRPARSVAGGVAVAETPAPDRRARLLSLTGGDAALAAEQGDVGDPSLLVMVALYRATLPGGDPEAARATFRALEPRLKLDVRLEAHHLLGRAAGDPADLEASRRLRAQAVAGAPPAARLAMLERVPLHRAVGDGRRGRSGTVR